MTLVGQRPEVPHEKEVAKLRREIDRLVTALASTDDKPDAIVEGIASRQARVRELEAQVAVAKLAPAAMDAELGKIEQAALEAVERLRVTLEVNPQEGRAVLAALFDRLDFTPVATPDGPRFRIEGTAKTGRLLGIEGLRDRFRISPNTGESSVRYARVSLVRRRRYGSICDRARND